MMRSTLIFLISFAIFIALMLYFCNSFNQTHFNKSQYLELERYYGKYYINTTGCRTPFFPVELPKSFGSCIPKFDCGKSMFLASDIDRHLISNMTLEDYREFFKNWDSINCYYNEFIRINDTHIKHLERYYFTFDVDKPIPIKDGKEFIHLECYDNYHLTYYSDYFFFAVEKYETGYENLRSNDTNQEKLKDRLSVMILGIDSVSHLNFLRQMKRTTNFIHQYSGSVEFWGQNKIGCQTYPNMIPALTGLTVEELEKSCHKGNKRFDNCSMIWQKFKNFNFKTMYAEDVARLGLFHYLKSGFIKQPTDYYLHTLVRQLELYLVERETKKHCVHGRQLDDILLESARKMIPLFLKHDFFSIIWEVTITHDCLNMASMYDNGLEDLLTKFNETGVLNKTFIFLMSDHGLRWGPIYRTLRGRYEDRHTMLVTLYPKWVEKAYPLAIKNLKVNSKRLTTVFDIYETMLDLVDIRNLDEKILQNRINQINKEEKLSRGISLFLPVPASRTCKDAGISSEYCNCMTLKYLKRNDPEALLAASFTVKHINSLLSQYPECEQLKYSSIIWSRKLLNPDSIEFVSIQFLSEPGNGIFESTVLIAGSSSRLNELIRVNEYGETALCTHDKKVKQFCYCKSPKA